MQAAVRPTTISKNNATLIGHMTSNSFADSSITTENLKFVYKMTGERYVNDNELQQVTTSDNEQQQVVISVKLSFFSNNMSISILKMKR